MRLKRLEALGFKSFANKTTVLFDAHSKEGERPKIIGIVGPNGCGKSNVVDALLWILGEQSFRELRAKTKEDIIFAGTDTEAPHSMAEVSIVLGLEPGEGAKISPDFNDASEVMMTRRIYRSGESEFLINKQPCRLQDISSFFLDTGAGQGSYSIISQGQIDSLIQSKPEEKRQLIEEASGIASFRIQRRRAFMKLESTQENLNRIKDIIKEVERKLKSLKKYAERAQRYKQAREELRDIDLALAAKTYSELKEQLEQLKIQFETISKNEEEKSKGFEENVKAIFQKEGFIAEEREKHSENQELLLKESTLLEKKKGDLNFKTSKFNDISQNAETLTKQYKKIQDRKDGLTKQINLLEVEIKNLDEQVHIVKQTLSSDINLENIPHQIKLKKQQIKDLRERNVEGLLKIKTKESQVEGILKEVIGIQEEIKNFTTKKEGVLEKRNAEKEHEEELQQKQSNFKEEYETLNTTLVEKEEILQQLKMQLSTQEETYKTYQNKLTQAQISLKVLSKFRVEDEVLENETLTFVHDIFSIPEKYETVVALALRGLLKGIVLNSQEEIKQFISREKKPSKFVLVPSYIKRQEQKNLFFSSVPEQEKLSSYIKAKKGYEDLKEYLFGNCFVVTSIHEALQKWQQGVVLISDDGYVMSADGVVYCDVSSQENLFQQKRKCEDQLNLLTQTTNTILKEISSIKQKIDGLTQEENLLEKQVESLKENIINIEHDATYSQEKLDQLQHVLDELEESQSVFNAKIEKHTAHKDTLEKEIASLSSESQIVQTQLGASESALSILEESQHNTDIQQKQEKLQLLKEKETALKSNLDAMTEQVRECDEELNNVIQGLKAANKDIEQELFKFKENKHGVNLKLQEFELKLKYCVDEIRENYVLEIETYYREVSVDFKVTDYRQKQKALRAELRSLGEIPLSVISEYEEKQKRFDFLVGQRDDLLASVDNLQKTITKLDKLSKDKFQVL